MLKDYWILFFLLSCFQGFSQYEHLLHKSEKEKIPGITALYEKVVENTPDSTQAFAIVDGIKKMAIKHGDETLMLEMDLLRAYYYKIHFPGNQQEVLLRLKALAGKCKQLGNLQVEAKAVNEIAWYYWEYAKDYEKAFKWFFRLENILENEPAKRFATMAYYMNRLGHAYYRFADYKKAVFYFKKTLSLPKTETRPKHIFDALNSLGLSYQKLDSLRISDQYFLTIIKDTMVSQIYKGIASGNLGYNHYLRGDYDKAIPLMRFCIEEAREYGDLGLAAGSSIPLAAIFLKQNKLEKAGRYIRDAEKYIQVSKQYDRLRFLYPVMGKWYAKMGKPDSSVVYMDSAITAIKSYNQKFNTRKLLRASQIVNAERLKVQKIKTESQTKIGRRNLVLFTLLVLIFVALYAYYRQIQNIRRKKQLRKERIRVAEEELKTAKAQLNKFLRQISEKNKLVATLQNNTKSTEHQSTLEQLRQSVILTDEDWQDFNLMFKKVFPGFQKSLKSKKAQFTPAETRCLSLLKLGLSNKEMASMLGVSVNTVIVTQHRLRKKLGLGSQKNLGKMVERL